MADERDVAAAGAAAAKGAGPGRGGDGGVRTEGAAKAGGSPGGDGRSAIERLRSTMDAIDDQLLKLFNARSACAVEIGHIKRSLGLPIYVPEREAFVLDRVARTNPGPLDAGAVRRVFERIIDESRRLERLAGEQEDEKGKV
jgi:chorismate mutase